MSAISILICPNGMPLKLARLLADRQEVLGHSLTLTDTLPRSPWLWGKRYNLVLEESTQAEERILKRLRSMLTHAMVDIVATVGTSALLLSASNRSFAARADIRFAMCLPMRAELRATPEMAWSLAESRSHSARELDVRRWRVS